MVAVVVVVVVIVMGMDRVKREFLTIMVAADRTAQ
jgi:hypothetical protein